MLNKDLRQAEDILLAHNQTDEAINMYQTVHQFDEAIAVADSRKHADAAQMREDYFALLKRTNQEEKAAKLKEDEGDYETAIKLYLKGGLPAKAANVIKSRNEMLGNSQLLELVASALTTAGLHDRAGEFYEQMDQLQRALDAYIKGSAYRQAVELARRHFPSQVVELQEAWGDWLVSQKQVDMAINHYIEANCSTRRSNLRSIRGSGRRLLSLSKTSTAMPRGRILSVSQGSEESKQLDEAERFYVAADSHKAAVEMYTKHSQWDKVHKLATSYMSFASMF